MARRSLLLGIFFVLVASPSVFAQDATDSADTTESAPPSTQREALIQRRLEAREAVSATQQQIREDVAQRRQAFQQRLSSIADTARQRVIQRIDTQLRLANETLTSKFEEALNSLSNIVDKIDMQKDGLEASGTDVTELENATAEARQAIEDARVLVAEQAEREYIINITSDAALGQSARDAIQQLRSDINTLRDEIVQVKDTVKEAAQLATAF